MRFLPFAILFLAASPAFAQKALPPDLQESAQDEQAAFTLMRHLDKDMADQMREIVTLRADVARLTAELEKSKGAAPTTTRP